MQPSLSCNWQVNQAGSCTSATTHNLKVVLCMAIAVAVEPKSPYLAQPFRSEIAASSLKGNGQPGCCVLMQPCDCLGQLGRHTQLRHGLYGPAAPLAQPQCMGVLPIFLGIPAEP